jgi:hypothetical protein
MASRLWLILILALQPVFTLTPALATASPMAEEPTQCCALCVCDGCECAAEAPDAPEPREPMAPAPAPKLIAPDEPVPMRAGAPAEAARPRPAELATTRRTAAGLASIRLLGIWRT